MKDQHIIVIGGTSGIGLESARRFAAQGARVTVTGRDAAKGAALDVPGVRFAQLDAAVRVQCDAFFAEHGPFDHLVVCASGAAGAGTFRDLALDDLRAGFDGKFWPQLNVLQASLAHIAAGGSLISGGLATSFATRSGTISFGIFARSPIEETISGSAKRRSASVGRHVPESASV